MDATTNVGNAKRARPQIESLFVSSVAALATFNEPIFRSFKRKVSSKVRKVAGSQALRDS